MTVKLPQWPTASRAKVAARNSMVVAAKHQTTSLLTDFFMRKYERTVMNMLDFIGFFLPRKKMMLNVVILKHFLKCLNIYTIRLILCKSRHCNLNFIQSGQA